MMETKPYKKTILWNGDSICYGGVTQGSWATRLQALFEADGKNYSRGGGTITEEVPEDALVVARARAVVKPLWAKKRREDGKL